MHSLQTTSEMPAEVINASLGYLKIPSKCHQMGFSYSQQVFDIKQAYTNYTKNLNRHSRWGHILINVYNTTIC